MKKVLSIVLVLILVLSMITGCSSSSSKNSADVFLETASTASGGGFFGNINKGIIADEPAAPPRYDDDYGEMKEMEGSDEGNKQEQKLIKTGFMQIEVKDIKGSYIAIKGLLSGKDGYIVDLQERNSSYNSYMYVSLKIESSKFETFFEELKELGKVKESNIKSQDVTTQYIDTEARLKTLKIQEETLQGIMSKADKVEDLLRVEQELQRVRQQIESSQGQLNYLDNAVGYSAIEINLQSEIEPTFIIEEDESIFEKFLFSLKDGAGYWGNVLLNIISSILWLLPIIIVGVLVFIFGRKYIIKRKQNKPLKKGQKIDKNKDE